MNILFVSRLYPAYAGQPVDETSYALYAFTREWVRTGHNVLVIRPYYVPHNTRKFMKIRTGVKRIDNVRVQVEHFWRLPKTNIVYYFPLFKFFNLRRFGKILSVLKEAKYDVVIGHMTDGFLIADVLAQKLGVPLICGIHQNDTLEHLRSPFCRRKILSVLNRASSIACRSAVLKKRLAEKYLQYAPKLFLAQSGIDEKNILPRQEYLAKAKMKTLRFISVCVMRDPTKNIHINLQALAGLKNMDWHYTIVGDGEDRPRLERLVDKLALRSRITFTGLLPVSEVAEHLCSADFYLMISAPETFGLTYLEAMAAGLIVVGARGQGIDGVIVDGQNGFLAEPASVGDLQRVIRRILALSLAEKKNILQNAYETIKKYTIQRKALEYLQNLEKYVDH